FRQYRDFSFLARTGAHPAKKAPPKTVAQKTTPATDTERAHPEAAANAGGPLEEVTGIAAAGEAVKPGPKNPSPAKPDAPPAPPPAPGGTDAPPSPGPGA